MNLLWLCFICPLISVSNGACIPGFAGDCAVRDTADYEEAAYQYATTSNEDGAMRPQMILYPNNDNDVIAAIKYAKKNGIAIAVRTGGHQYSGASSTGGDNIQLDMSRTYMEFEWNETSGLLRVGVSWRLRELDARMGSNGLFVPHGQCSNVHVGGHSHTGGWGSLCRGFGLFGDHIQSIEYITADGQVRTIHRTTQVPAEKDLFYAVLGGSPGNFGVLTHVTLRPHRNSAHPDSRGLKILYMYTKPVLKALLDVLVEMVNDNELAGDWDYCISVASSSVLTDVFANLTQNVDQEMLTRLGLISQQNAVPIPVIYVFAQWANLESGEAFDPTSSANWFKKMTDAATSAGAVTVLAPITPEHYTSMTDLNAAWVFGNVREFVMPFLKRGRVSDSKTLVQDGFTTAITDHIDATFRIPNSGVHLSGQFQVIGGKHSKFGQPPSGETAYSWRDSTSVFTLDAFYEPNSTVALNNAIAFERGVDEISADTFCPDDRRVLWSSFGDHNMENVWPYYYESRTKYDRLVRIKRTVDPTGVFTPNEFVVGGNFRPKGKNKPAPKKVRDADYAPKLRKKLDQQFEDLIYPTKKASPSTSSGKAKGAAAIGACGAALSVIFAITLRRRRTRVPKPADTTVGVSAAVTSSV